MKILCNYTPCGPHYVRTGWGRVMRACGHDFRFWLNDRKPAHDAFNEFEPDLYIGTTYELDRATINCITKRPEMKVALYASAWGHLVKDIDLKKYPLVVVNDKEKAAVEKLKKETGRPDFVFVHVSERFLQGTMGGWKEIGVEPYGIMNAADTFVYLNGQRREDLACDVAFVGGYWGYKSRNLDEFILPLCHPSKGLSVKIFGNQPWPVHNFLGLIDDQVVPHLFASATVCPNVSEPHSTDLGWDVIERPFKVLSSGGFCVSDYVEEMAETDMFDGAVPFVTSGKSMEELVRHYIAHPEDRLPFMEKGRRIVLQKHTYFDRVQQMFECLGMRDEAVVVGQTKLNTLTK